MTNSFWNKDEEDFRDIPDEVTDGQSAPMPVLNASNVQRPAPVQRAAPQVVLEKDVDIQFPLDDEEEDYTAILADANLRIEQGTLYKMIMNHNLFEGLEVDARAVDNVTREIRRFAKERMEIMLGMRQEAVKESIVSSPFNDLEVTILKRVASAASKGATESPDANKTAAVVKSAPKREGLTPIGNPPKPAQKPVPATKTPLATKPQTPIARTKAPVPPKVINEDNYEPLEKPVSKMTEDEIIKRNQEASARQAGKKSVKSTSALAQPSFEQEQMLHDSRSNENMNPAAVSAIITALNSNKKQ